MGRIVTPRYRLDLEMRSDTGRIFRTEAMAWHERKRGMIPGYGAPTIKNLRRLVAAFEEGTRAGPNKHLGAMTVLGAWISHNTGPCAGVVIAEWIRAEGA